MFRPSHRGIEMNLGRWGILLAVAMLLSIGGVRAETTECTGIASLPATITVPGVYCFKQDLATSQTSGAAITVTANSVTLDMNGWKLGGLTGGPNSQADGVVGTNIKNFILRNGTIKGFRKGVSLVGIGTEGEGHIVEDMLLDANLLMGISVNNVSRYQVRRNTVLNTGNGTKGVVGISATGNSAIIADNFVSNVNGKNYPTITTGMDIQVIDGTVERNTVTNVTSDGLGFGILVMGSNNLVVQSNKVIGLGNAAMSGIYLSIGNGIMLLENVVTSVLTTAATGIAIESNVANVSCIRNVVDGFTTPMEPCAFEAGNLAP